VFDVLDDPGGRNSACSGESRQQLARAVPVVGAAVREVDRGEPPAGLLDQISQCGHVGADVLGVGQHASVDPKISVEVVGEKVPSAASKLWNGLQYTWARGTLAPAEAETVTSSPVRQACDWGRTSAGLSA
jgi:hypothetical protein